MSTVLSGMRLEGEILCISSLSGILSLCELPTGPWVSWLGGVTFQITLFVSLCTELLGVVKVVTTFNLESLPAVLCFEGIYQFLHNIHCNGNANVLVFSVCVCAVCWPVGQMMYRSSSGILSCTAQ